MIPRTTLLLPRGALLAGAPLLFLSCGGGAEEAETAGRTLPEAVEITEPEPRIVRLELVEDLSEEVADRLLSYSDKLRRRDFTAAGDWLTDDFHGHAFHGLPVAERATEQLDVERVTYDPRGAAVADKEGFLDGLRESLGSWERVESVLWKVKGAEFQQGRGERWGKIKLFVHATGWRGGGIASVAWGYARVVHRGGDWRIERFRLDSYEELSRRGPIFTDVAAAAGVAHAGARFGSTENRSFAFNGAACGDVDGDGRLDLFVPSDDRNFLYVGTDVGTFREEAAARGVLGPDGGTGCVLFDHDNDGDQDLVVGHAPDGIGGERFELYENDGEGRFARVEGAKGLAAADWVAFSLTVLDYDGDGWLDLYASCYGIVAEEHNNSWIEATNGSPNALFRNVGGERFEEVGEAAGVRGSSWSYASAAADWDRDGDTDLYVANDYGTNRLYRNEGDGTFTDVAEECGVRDQGNGMGVAFGDLSGDGQLDLYVSNMSSTAGNRILDRYRDELADDVYAVLKKAAAGNTIFFARPDGSFEKLPKSAGGVGANWAWSAALADLDLDGRLDVFCTNGFVTGNLPFDT